MQPSTSVPVEEYLRSPTIRIWTTWKGSLWSGTWASIVTAAWSYLCPLLLGPRERERGFTF